MLLIKTEKQKDSLAKFFYDVAKIFLAIMVVTPIVQLGNFNPRVFLLGSLATLISFLLAFILDGKEITS